MVVRRKQTRSKADGEATVFAWIELFSEAVAVVDSEARVLVRNRAADRLFRRSGIVRLRDQRLRVSCNGNQGRFDELIAGAVETSEGPRYLQLWRVENGEAVCVSARRMDPGPRVLVFLSDGHVEIDSATRRRMRDLWNLSAVEARVAAAVVEGTDLKTYAHENGVSPHTVRSQLNTVFAKTGAGRQADLVRLVLRGPAYLAWDSYK